MDDWCLWVRSIGKRHSDRQERNLRFGRYAVRQWAGRKTVDMGLFHEELDLGICFVLCR